MTRGSSPDQAARSRGRVGGAHQGLAHQDGRRAGLRPPRATSARDRDPTLEHRDPLAGHAGQLPPSALRTSTSSVSRSRALTPITWASVASARSRSGRRASRAARPSRGRAASASIATSTSSSRAAAISRTASAPCSARLDDLRRDRPGSPCAAAVARRRPAPPAGRASDPAKWRGSVRTEIGGGARRGVGACLRDGIGVRGDRAGARRGALHLGDHGDAVALAARPRGRAAGPGRPRVGGGRPRPAAQLGARRAPRRRSR